MRRYSFLLLSSVWILGGCCATLPRPEKYFDLQTPMNAVRGFVYGVESEEWEFAYNSLTPESREQFSETKMYFAILLYKDPKTSVGLYDLITKSELNRGFLDWDPLNPNRLSASLMCQYDYINERGIEDTILFEIYLKKRNSTDKDGAEIDRWEIDLMRTAATFAPEA